MISISLMFVLFLVKVLSHPHKQEQYQETLVRISSLIQQSVIEQMKKNFSDDMENTYHYYFIKCYMQAIEMTCSCPDVEKFNKDCCTFLPMVLEKAFSIISSSNVCKITFYFVVHNSILVFVVYFFIIIVVCF